MKLSILFCSLSVSLMAIADGNRVGNGGDVVVCANSTQILDIYEASEISEKIKSLNSSQEIQQMLLKKLAEVSPEQERMYRPRVRDFEANSEFKDDANLTDIDDSKSVFATKSESCQIKQIAIRKNLSLATEKKFIIDNTQWKKLDVLNQTALVFHEIIYEHFYKLGEKDSVKARKLNAYLFSDRFLQASKDEYWKTLKELKVPIYQR